MHTPGNSASSVREAPRVQVGQCVVIPFWPFSTYVSTEQKLQWTKPRTASTSEGRDEEGALAQSSANLLATGHLIELAQVLGQQGRWSHLTVFFFHNKSTNNIFIYNFSYKWTWLLVVTLSEERRIFFFFSIGWSTRISLRGETDLVRGTGLTRDASPAFRLCSGPRRARVAWIQLHRKLREPSSAPPEHAPTHVDERAA